MFAYADITIADITINENFYIFIYGIHTHSEPNGNCGKFCNCRFYILKIFYILVISNFLTHSKPHKKNATVNYNPAINRSLSFYHSIITHRIFFAASQTSSKDTLRVVNTMHFTL